jgi:hypothetical protein
VINLFMVQFSEFLIEFFYAVRTDTGSYITKLYQPLTTVKAGCRE